jgi:hypothetical protein
MLGLGMALSLNDESQSYSILSYMDSLCSESQLQFAHGRGRTVGYYDCRVHEVEGSSLQ